MAETPIVSVIMGVYNTNNENMLRLAIDSILNQTLSNIEFIICDDGSIDGTYETLIRLYGKYKNIVIIRNKENSGLAKTLNNCLKIAKGKYIARMDADDISNIDRLKIQMEFLEEYKEYSFVGCCSLLFNDNCIWGERKTKENPDKEDFLFGTPFIHPTIMMRKEVYEALNGYKVSKLTRRAEDYDLFMRAYAKGFKGYNIQQNLYSFREDNNAYKRRAYKHRLEEAKVRYYGFKELNLLPKGYIYILKPIIVGLIPQKILSIFRNEKK